MPIDLLRSVDGSTGAPQVVESPVPLMPPDRAQALNAPLETERLLLEPLLAAHADVLCEPLQDPAIYTWISLRVPQSIEHLKKWWILLETRISPDGDLAYLNWVVRRRSDGAYLGKVDADVDTRCIAPNIGYVFFPPFWGQGYASEAVRAVVVQFARQGITEVRATVTMGNDASGRVLEKVGFVRTRIIPENDTIRGVKYDDIEYVLKTHILNSSLP